jgi:hypothetical protein
VPISLGTPIGVSSVIDRINDPGMTTAIGLVLWGKHMRGVTNTKGLGQIMSKIGGLEKVGSGFMKMLKQLKP